MINNLRALYEFFSVYKCFRESVRQFSVLKVRSQNVSTADGMTFEYSSIDCVSGRKYTGTPGIGFETKQTFCTW